MSNDCYNTFCPIAKAYDIVGSRWTMLIMSEMWQGSMRFNEIRRGIPGISPTLLSKRLKEMEKNGLIHRVEIGGGELGYTTTPLANELAPVVMALGKWAHRNIDSEITLENLNARLLMWNMRRKVDAAVLPKAKTTVIQFTYPELAAEEREYWLVSKPGQPVDLCLIDPSHEVDLFIRADLKAMTSAWMGWSTLRGEIGREKIVLVGDRKLASSVERWLVGSGLGTSERERAAA